jgi:hypothetical protein
MEYFKENDTKLLISKSPKNLLPISIILTQMSKIVCIIVKYFIVLLKYSKARSGGILKRVKSSFREMAASWCILAMKK